MVLGRPVVEWVAHQIGATFSEHAHGIGWRRDGEITCGAVYEGWNGVNIYVHLAKMRGTKFPAAFIAAFVDYPFNQLEARRMSAVIASTNFQSLAFAEKLGARLEGVMPEATQGGDLHVYGLLREHAKKWLSEPYQRRLGEFRGRSNQRHDRDRERARQWQGGRSAACA
jgi:hypothetical protein